MKVAASPRSRAQVAAVLAFVISHTTFLAAQDDETGRCPKVVFKLQVTGYQSPVHHPHFPKINLTPILLRAIVGSIKKALEQEE